MLSRIRVLSLQHFGQVEAEVRHVYKENARSYGEEPFAYSGKLFDCFYL